MTKEKIALLLETASGVIQALDEVVRLDEFDDAEYPGIEDEEDGTDEVLSAFAEAIRSASENISEAMSGLDQIIHPEDYADDGSYEPAVQSDESIDDDKYNEYMDDYQDMYEVKSK